MKSAALVCRFCGYAFDPVKAAALANTAPLLEVPPTTSVPPSAGQPTTSKAEPEQSEARVNDEQPQPIELAPTPASDESHRVSLAPAAAIGDAPGVAGSAFLSQAGTEANHADEFPSEGGSSVRPDNGIDADLLTAAQIALVRDFAVREGHLTKESRRRVASEIARSLRARVPGSESYSDDLTFLRRLASATEGGATPLAPEPANDVPARPVTSPELTRRPRLIAIGIVVGVLLIAADWPWVLLSVALAGLAIAALVPRLGPAILERIGWRRLPQVGQFAGLRASLILVGLLLFSSFAHAAIRPATTDSTTAGTLAVAPSRTVAAAQPLVPTPIPTTPPTPIRTTPPTPVPTVAPTARPTPSPAHIGSIIDAGNWRYSVRQVDTAKTYTTGSGFLASTYAAKGIWVIVLIQLTNIGKQNYAINDFDFELRDAKGIKYNPASSYSFDLPPGYMNFGEQIPPGVPQLAHLYFDVAPGTSGMYLYLSNVGLFDKTAVIYLY